MELGEKFSRLLKQDPIIKDVSIYLLLTAFVLLCACTSGSETNSIVIPPSGENSTENGNNNNGNVVQGCIERTPPTEVPVFDTGTTFPEWSSSEYVLPYAIGSTFFVNQGNNSGFGHSGFWKYGYDFTMNIGTEIFAARAGVVVHANDGTADGNPNGTNLITIQHSDGTVALYSHLTNNGVLVQVGDSIKQGSLIGLSGNTGNTGGLPHLHFSVHPCSGLPGLPNETNCPTSPVTFNNTEANPSGLGTWQCYTALAFEKDRS